MQAVTTCFISQVSSYPVTLIHSKIIHSQTKTRHSIFARFAKSYFQKVKHVTNSYCVSKHRNSTVIPHPINYHIRIYIIIVLTPIYILIENKQRPNFLLFAINKRSHTPYKHFASSYYRFANDFQW